MPFIRATSMVSPVDHVTPGFWLQLSTDAVGTWIGQAQTAWPQPVIGTDTLASYATKVSNTYAGLCKRPSPSNANLIVVNVIFTFTSLSPITIDPNNPPIVTEGDCKLVKVK